MEYGDTPRSTRGLTTALTSFRDARDLTGSDLQSGREEKTLVPAYRSEVRRP